MSDPTRSNASTSGDGPIHPQRTTAYVVAGILLAAPFVALLWVTSYNKDKPRLWGFPFFYWYQFLWVVITAVLTSIAYLLVSGTERTRGQLTDRPADRSER
jgi:Na+/proline symporter